MVRPLIPVALVRHSRYPNSNEPNIQPAGDSTFPSTPILSARRSRGGVSRGGLRSCDGGKGHDVLYRMYYTYRKPPEPRETHTTWHSTGDSDPLIRHVTDVRSCTGCHIHTHQLSQVEGDRRTLGDGDGLVTGKVEGARYHCLFSSRPINSPRSPITLSSSFRSPCDPRHLLHFES